MNTEYYREYSHNLGRDMEYKVYGHAGKPMLVFPCQDGRFFDFEDRGMVDCAREYIDQGRLQLFCCDSNDQNSWSRIGDWDNRKRIEQQEAYFRYICDECIGIYLAQDLSSGDCDPDDDEFLEVEKIPLEKAVKMIVKGEIKDAKTQAAILKLKYLIDNKMI